MEEKIRKIIEALSKKAEPIKLSIENGFKDPKDLGAFMKENKYIWDPKSQNYFKLEERKELIGRYSFKSSQSPPNLASQQLPELEDYHSLPLHLKKDSYQKLVLYIRKYNLDYNKLIEDALDFYLSQNFSPADNDKKLYL